MHYFGQSLSVVYHVFINRFTRSVCIRLNSLYAAIAYYNSSSYLLLFDLRFERMY